MLPAPRVLCIAGTDPSGGAGLLADIKSVAANGGYGMGVVAALTAQNTRGVRGVHVPPVGFLADQLYAVSDDIVIDAVKIGMLGTAEVADTVGEWLTAVRPPVVVLDPVMVATSGDRLLAPDAERTIATELLPLAALATPNLDESTLLVGFEVADLAAMRRAAAALVEMGARAALVKGGHLRGPELVDVLFDGREFHEWRRPKLDTTSTHGTGCTLSSAVAAGLAWGRPLRESVEDALDYVQRAIRGAPGLGGGHGPLNHMIPWKAESPASVSSD